MSKFNLSRSINKYVVPMIRVKMGPGWTVQTNEDKSIVTLSKVRNKDSFGIAYTIPLTWTMVTYAEHMNSLTRKDQPSNYRSGIGIDMKIDPQKITITLINPNGTEKVIPYTEEAKQVEQFEWMLMSFPSTQEERSKIDFIIHDSSDYQEVIHKALRVKVSSCKVGDTISVSDRFEVVHIDDQVAILKTKTWVQSSSLAVNVKTGEIAYLIKLDKKVDWQGKASSYAAEFGMFGTGIA